MGAYVVLWEDGSNRHTWLSQGSHRVFYLHRSSSWGGTFTIVCTRFPVVYGKPSLLRYLAQKRQAKGTRMFVFEISKAQIV